MRTDASACQKPCGDLASIRVATLHFKCQILAKQRNAQFIHANLWANIEMR
jgi:hypothetical protein